MKSLTSEGLSLSLILPPMARLESHLIDVTWRALLASSGSRPGMLLNLLQCTQGGPTAKTYPTQKVNGAEHKKPKV